MPNAWEIRRTLRIESDALYWLVTDVVALCDLTPQWDELWQTTGRVVRDISLRHAKLVAG